MNTVIVGATSWLATYMLHSTLLLLGALAVTRRLREPAARERVWKIALTAPLLTVSMAYLLPGGERPVLDLAPRWLAESQPVAATAAPLAPPSAITARGDSPAAARDEVSGLMNRSEALTVSDDGRLVSDRTSFPHGPGLAVMALWLVGAGWLLARRAVGLRRLTARLATRREVREGTAHQLLAELCSDDELTIRPRLTVADELSTPLVLGVSEICLPRRVAEELPTRELAAILAHEVAHVRRGDLLWLRGCALLECLLFMQPLNRLASRRCAQDAELLCDDWAGERTGARLELAQGLETVARWSRATSRSLPVPCLGGDRGALLQRVERLLAEPERRRRTLGITVALGGAVLLLAWVGPGVQLASQGAPDIDKLDVDALIALRKQSCALAADRLLAPPAGWEQTWADLLAVPDTRIVRILQRGLYDLSPKDEGGAYYSFATDDHDYQRQPDLGYERDEIKTAFAGDDTGDLLDLGEVPLADVTTDGPIPGLDAETARRRAFVSSYVPAGEGQADSAFQQAIGTTTVGRARAIAGHSYLLRAILPDRHDHLVAFTLVQVQPESVVLVGRILKTWPVAEPQVSRPRADWSSEGAPDWLRQLDDTSLFALQASLASLIERRLLAVPADVIAAAGELGQAPDAGVTKLLPRGRYDGVVKIRLAGNYFSFATRSHSYDDQPDLAWTGKQLSSGFHGSNGGAFLDLGDVPLASLDLAQEPTGLNDDGRAIWEQLQASSLGRELCRSCSSVPVVVGHTYVLRSVLKGEHDLLTAFRTLQQDDGGLIIAWRILRRYTD